MGKIATERRGVNSVASVCSVAEASRHLRMPERMPRVGGLAGLDQKPKREIGLPAAQFLRAFSLKNRLLNSS